MHIHLVWNVLENFIFKSENMLEYILIRFRGNAYLFPETTDTEHLNYSILS